MMGVYQGSYYKSKLLLTLYFSKVCSYGYSNIKTVWMSDLSKDWNRWEIQFVTFIWFTELMKEVLVCVDAVTYTHTRCNSPHNSWVKGSQGCLHRRVLPPWKRTLNMVSSIWFHHGGKPLAWRICTSEPLPIRSWLRVTDNRCDLHFRKHYPNPCEVRYRREKE